MLRSGSFSNSGRTIERYVCVLFNVLTLWARKLKKDTLQNDLSNTRYERATVVRRILVYSGHGESSLVHVSVWISDYPPADKTLLSFVFVLQKRLVFPSFKYQKQTSKWLSGVRRHICVIWSGHCTSVTLALTSLGANRWWSEVSCRWGRKCMCSCSWRCWGCPWPKRGHAYWPLNPCWTGMLWRAATSPFSTTSIMWDPGKLVMKSSNSTRCSW